MTRLIFALLSAALPLLAQNEIELRRHFEGLSVIVRIDMPGSSDGVTVHPSAEIPLDFRRLANDLKRYTTAIREGDRIQVTKVFVKKDHIEFHLGGGGFGTFGDMMSTPSAPSSSYSKSRYERELEDRLKSATGNERDRLRTELERERRNRSRENSANAQARIEREALIMEKRQRGGSRFNIHYREGIPAEALTIDGIKAALARYVEFPDSPSKTGGYIEQAPTLRKGMTVAEVEQILGPAQDITRQSQGYIEIVTRKYGAQNRQAISARFVNGVLVEFN
jgi:hypothetical protein